jgi:hypothetical protein
VQRCCGCMLLAAALLRLCVSPCSPPRSRAARRGAGRCRGVSQRKQSEKESAAAQQRRSVQREARRSLGSASAPRGANATRRLVLRPRSRVAALSLSRSRRAREAEGQRRAHLSCRYSAGLQGSIAAPLPAFDRGLVVSGVAAPSAEAAPDGSQRPRQRQAVRAERRRIPTPAPSASPSCALLWCARAAAPCGEMKVGRDEAAGGRGGG